MNKQKIIDHTLKAQKNASAPYSKYKVAAALETLDGTVIYGCNVESKAYPTTLCAERVAIFSAISSGYRNFKWLSVATEDGAYPCGSCRQIIAEYLGDAPIFVINSRTMYLLKTSIDKLLPHPFK